MTPRHFVVPAYLMLCVLLGGASLAGYLSNLILQLLALPIVVWALFREQRNQPRPARTLVMLLAALVAVVLVQLIPLPPALWTSLPGRARVAEGFGMLGQPLPWLPLSLDPEGTLAALLWLLPAIAGLLGVVRLGAYRTSVLAWCLIAITMISVGISAMQLAGGQGSPFYFYRVTNFGVGVGFFANSNHQAALLLCTIPFVAALYAGKSRLRSLKSASGLAIALGGIMLVLAVGLYLNRSLAGLGLGVAVTLASLLLLRYRARRLPGWAPIASAGALAAAVAVILFGPLSGGAFDKEIETSTNSRQIMIANTAEAAVDHLPFGSGVGTFAEVYRTYEEPGEVDTTWVNHAHSDLVEMVLETGVLGLLLLLAFLLWWGRRAWAVWQHSERPDNYARAAVIASAAILTHSLVDYPLRTAAISTLFAVCLALMAQPRPSTQPRAGGRDEAEAVRHLSA